MVRIIRTQKSNPKEAYEAFLKDNDNYLEVPAEVWEGLDKVATLQGIYMAIITSQSLNIPKVLLQLMNNQRKFTKF